MTYCPETHEPLNPDECHDARTDCQLLDPALFGEGSPVLDGVAVLEVHGYWDGPMSGICEMNGQSFYFDTLVESVWRFYDKQTKAAWQGKKFQRVSRLWRIFAVYDLPLSDVQDIPKGGKERAEWLADEADIIGIFWHYEARYRDKKTQTGGSSPKEEV